RPNGKSSGNRSSRSTGRAMSSPARSLARSLLSADHGGDRFMTMHLSIIDAQTGSMRWVSAGHDPAPVYHPPAARFEEVGEGDLPLGVMDDTDYAEQTYGPLREGLVILVGTDGVWEMPDAKGEQFGKERLRDVIRKAAGGSAAEISQTLCDRLLDFRGDQQAVDDVTFVIVKVVTSGASGLPPPS